MKRQIPSDTRIAAVVLALAVLSLPLLSVSASAQARDKRLPLVTVQLENGERVTLRDAEFLTQRRGEGPRGSKPPGTPTGPVPGSAPGGYPGEAGDAWSDGRDPRQPGATFGGGRRGNGLGIGIDERDLLHVRRIDIVRVENSVTYADFSYKNGEVRVNVPMTWTALSGWERPAEQGEFYFFEAQEIRYLEFPRY